MMIMMSALTHNFFYALFKLLGVELRLLSRSVLAIFFALNGGGEIVRLVKTVRLRALVNEARPEK